MKDGTVPATGLRQRSTAMAIRAHTLGAVSLETAAARSVLRMSEAECLQVTMTADSEATATRLARSAVAAKLAAGRRCMVRSGRCSGISVSLAKARNGPWR